MAALRKDSAFFAWFHKPQLKSDSKLARAFARSVYKETGGVTPTLKRMNDEFLANQQPDQPKRGCAS